MDFENSQTGARHSQIEQNDSRPVFLYRVQAFRDVACSENFETGIGEGLSNEAETLGFVVNRQKLGNTVIVH